MFRGTGQRVARFRLRPTKGRGSGSPGIATGVLTAHAARKLQDLRINRAEIEPEDAVDEAFGGWILGSERFVARLRSQAGAIASNPPLAEARQLAGLDPKRILAAVADYYGLEVSALSRRHDAHLARAVAAWLCRRHTEASLRELAEWLGVSRADSVPNLTRRLEARLKASPRLAGDLAKTMSRANGPAESRRPAKSVQTQAPGQSGRTKTKNEA